LEAEGQRLLAEQLKAMLKALALSNLLGGDACMGLFDVKLDIHPQCSATVVPGGGDEESYSGDSIAHRPKVAFQN
jgi:hypothetical protein